jgi:hypothetical protein
MVLKGAIGMMRLATTDGMKKDICYLGAKMHSQNIVE